MSAVDLKIPWYLYVKYIKHRRIHEGGAVIRLDERKCAARGGAIVKSPDRLQAEPIHCN